MIYTEEECCLKCGLLFEKCECEPDDFICLNGPACFHPYCPDHYGEWSE